MTDEQRGLLQVVRTNADILLRLVGQTLDFRKFETGQLRLNVKTVQLNETLKQWCDPFRALARKRWCATMCSRPMCPMRHGSM